MTPSAARALTLDERRQLTLRGATVFERVALLGSAQSDRAEESTPSDAARAAWRAWVQAFSPGDADALERRLSWDALDVTHLTRALSDDWLPDTPAEWTDWVDALVTSARAVAAERRALIRGSVLPERTLFEEAPPPFLDLLIPVLRAAWGPRRTAVGDARLVAAFAPEAWAALDRHLLREASKLAELALFDAFRDGRATRALGYDTFVQEMLERQYASFLVTHAVLARQLACVARRSASTTRELLQRLETDRAAIAETFNAGRDPGLVVDLEPALSDAHDGGRRVAVLHFRVERGEDTALAGPGIHGPAEAGHYVSIVYKPRSVQLECAFGDWLAWAAARGLEPRQRAPRAIVRGEYGWIERVAQEPFESQAQVREYYRRSGGLLCLAHVLRARDLHMENIVATREGPVAIDLETMLQPVGGAGAAAALGAPVAASETLVGDAAGTVEALPSHTGAAAEHCLTSGLLTFVVSRDGRRFDIGGLRGTGEGVAARARRTWHALETDAMHYAEDSTFHVPVANGVVMNGVTQPPDAYADAVLAGFAETYRFLLDRRDELLKEGGGLALFAGTRTRVLPRATVQYGTLLHVLARPAYQKDGRRWSVAHEALNRALNRSEVRPKIWDALAAERRALEALDIPHFSADVEGTALRAGDQRGESHFLRSGLSAVAERIRRMSEADLVTECDRLARALSQSVSSRFRVDPPASHVATPEDVASNESLLAHASWIAQEMLARKSVTESGDRRVWPTDLDAEGVRRHSLYEGSIGPVLFLAALAAVTDDPRYVTAARDGAASLRAALVAVSPSEAVGLGAASGLGSIVYGLTIIGTLLADSPTLDVAGTVARIISDERIEADAALDVYGGSAGAALALLALHRVNGDEAVLARAVRCGERLLQAAVPGASAQSWGAPGRSTFVGFAHGMAGVAYALGQLFGVTADRRFGEAARDAWRYVAERFLDRHGNWPVAGGPADGGSASDQAMVAWCHGAPGVLLAAALGSPDLVHLASFDQVDAALRMTAAVAAHPADHVCCGNMGRVEALFTCGRRLMRRDAVDAARWLAGGSIVRARSEGHFSLGGGAFEYRTFDPGFFRGVSGIAYTLLRLTAPARIPCVLAFEAPSRSRTTDVGRRL